MFDLVREAQHNGAASEWDEGSFRIHVQESLKDGSFMLVIAVDAINPDQERILQFINHGSGGGHVYALELRKFRFHDTELLELRLHGAPVVEPHTSSPPVWTETTAVGSASRRTFLLTNSDSFPEGARLAVINPTS